MELTAMVAMMTSTPLPDVWSMTVGQVIRYAGKIRVLARMMNPVYTIFDRDEEPDGTMKIGGKTVRSADQLLAAFQTMR